MFTFLIILASLVSVNGDNFKIVGGLNSTISQHPYQGVYYSKNEFVCSCSLLSNYFALTAAHCTYYFPIQISLRFGTSYRNRDGVTVNVTKFFSHPNYDPKTFNNDFSILKFASIIRYTMQVRPITLPSSGRELKIGTNCSVSGWGLTSYGGNSDPPIQLLSTYVFVVDFQQCYRNYQLIAQNLTNQMFCAAAQTSRGNQDACLGDSGGPLVCNNTLNGVVSFGYGCALNNFPGIYSKVSAVIPWIKKVAQMTNTSSSEPSKDNLIK